MSPDRTRGALGIALLVLAGVCVLCALIAGVAWLAAFERTSGGQVAVIRNGGPFDNNRIRGTLPEASSRTNVGLFSHVHKYSLLDLGDALIGLPQPAALLQDQLERR